MKSYLMKLDVYLIFWPIC